MCASENMCMRTWRVGTCVLGRVRTCIHGKIHIYVHGRVLTCVQGGVRICIQGQDVNSTKMRTWENI